MCPADARAHCDVPSMAGFRMSAGGRTRLAALALAAVLACLALPAAAPADHPPAPRDGHVPDAVEEALGGEVTELDSGLYEVDPPRGPPLTTHGPGHRGRDPSRPRPDPRPRGSRAPADLRHRLLPARPLRAPRPGPEPDRRGERPDPVVDQAHQRRAQRGGARDGRRSPPTTRCSATRRARSASTPSHRIPGRASTSVVSAAEDGGLRRAQRRLHDLLRLRPPALLRRRLLHPRRDARRRQREQHAAATTASPGGLLERRAPPMHENGHNQGAVQYDAPYSTGDGAHCCDENDVMCYADGGDLNPAGTCSSALHRPPLLRLRSRQLLRRRRPSRATTWRPTGTWARALNRFIEFDGPEVSAPADCPAAPAEPPPAAARRPRHPGRHHADPGTTPRPSSRSTAGRSPTPRRPRADGSATPSRSRAEARSSGQARLRRAVRRSARPLPALAGPETTLTEYDCRSAGPGFRRVVPGARPAPRDLAHRRPTLKGSGGSAYEIVARRRR